jgi:hypothetical protein
MLETIALFLWPFFWGTQDYPHYVYIGPLSLGVTYCEPWLQEEMAQYPDLEVIIMVLETEYMPETPDPYADRRPYKVVDTVGRLFLCDGFKHHLEPVGA